MEKLGKKVIPYWPLFWKTTATPRLTDLSTSALYPLFLNELAVSQPSSTDCRNNSDCPYEASTQEDKGLQRLQTPSARRASMDSS